MPNAIPDTPFKTRLMHALLWTGAYTAFWFFAWRPLDHWVNAVIVAAILLSVLPPLRVRPFAGALGWLAVGAVLYFVVKVRSPIMLLIVGISVIQNVISGINVLSSNPREN